MDSAAPFPQPDAWNLSPLAARLRAGRRRLVICTLAALGAALLLILLDRAHYRAEAIVAVARPGALLQFDARFAAVAGDASGFRVNSLRVYSELLQSEGMAQRVAKALESSGSSYTGSLEGQDLLAALRFRSLADGGLLQIEASGATPGDAALLAQTWAEVFCTAMAQTYATAGSSGVLGQRDRAAADLAAAEQALAEGYVETQSESLMLRWRSLQAAQAARLAADAQLAAVAADLAAISQAGGPLGEAGRLAGLRLGLEALGATAAASDTMGLQLSLPAGPADGAAFAVLTRQVTLRRAALADELTAGAEALDASRQALALAEGKQSGLRRARDLAEERYLTLARKADELAVADAAQAPEVRLASPATASDRLPWRDYALRLAAAVAAGLALGGLWVLLAAAPNPALTSTTGPASPAPAAPADPAAQTSSAASSPAGAATQPTRPTPPAAGGRA